MCHVKYNAIFFCPYSPFRVWSLKPKTTKVLGMPMQSHKTKEKKKFQVKMFVGHSVQFPSYLNTLMLAAAYRVMFFFVLR